MTRRADRKQYLCQRIFDEQRRFYDESNATTRRTLAQMFLWDYLSTLTLPALEHWYTNMVSTPRGTNEP